jgi:hypothetical protein
LILNFPALLPSAVKRGGENAVQDPWMVDYSRVTPLLTKAIQDLDRIKQSEAFVEFKHLLVADANRDNDFLSFFLFKPFHASVH